jgi:antitoxin (DNA-binding transcriptional repressor) of toxin-antitoxin stability system
MSRTPLDLVDACEQLQQAVRAAGEYAHVAVRVERGHLVLYAGHEAPVARLTPLGQAQYGLRFYRHHGRWERMPFSGAFAELAITLVDTLGPYLAQAKL